MEGAGYMSLESRARVAIDEKLRQAGWLVQDLGQMDISAGQGVAIREFPLSTGKADYLLVVHGEAVGVIEAKRSGTTLSGVKEQSAQYQTGLPHRASQIRFSRLPLPFSYETTDVEIFFTNDLEPDARSRSVFHYHRPETLAEWLRRAPDGVPKEQNDLLRSRLRCMPPLLDEGLRNCQYEAITELERSLAQNRPRALIQMATGSGKTYMAISSIYRLLRFGKAKRVLFLVDRTNLAIQTLNEFQQYTTVDTRRRFTEIYEVQHLQGDSFDGSSEVCITTIQRLYSILTGKPLEKEAEEVSAFEQVYDDEEAGKQPRTVTYNPAVPLEFFDAIFVDECHRSIYSEWRPVLEYFDAFTLGLTATPEKRAYAFFNGNIVYEYSQAQSVADGVNVDYEVYRLGTDITVHGSKVVRGNMLTYRNKQTREKTYETLKDDLIYESRHLDDAVVAVDQIRTIIRAYRDALFTELFPERAANPVVPKTLIFAKDDKHAEDILHIVREEFGKGNDFAKKITYNVSGVKPYELINQFRNSYDPRIVVSVDMISTGTDIKPLEVLIFMRAIKSRTLFEQMRGRGCRIISNDALRKVTPGRSSKTHYVVFDAVGITALPLQFPNPPLERKPRVSLAELMEQVAKGNYEEANLTSLARRLGRLVNYAKTKEDAEALRSLTGGTLPELAGGLLKALDYDQQLARAQQISGQANPPASVLEEAELQLTQEATQAFKNPEVRDLILTFARREKQAIDDISQDEVTFHGFDEDAPNQTVLSFRALIEQEANKKQIELFEQALNRPMSVPLSADIQAVARDITLPLPNLDTDNIARIWRAYQRLEADHVRGIGGRYDTDQIALIRYTIERETNPQAILEPFQDTINRRFNQWLATQQRTFTPLQHWWLDRIRDRIITDLQCRLANLNSGLGTKEGGRIGATNAFGGEMELAKIVRELNEKLLERQSA
jgi:type I restriction enzyme, R subunit